MSIETEFAPAERAPDEEVERQHSLLMSQPLVREFLDAMPNMAMVLNRERQIVFANNAFRAFVGAEDDDKFLVGSRYGEAVGCLHSAYLGLRPGEAAGCVRSGLTEGGCGTTEFCQTCGAVQSVLNSQRMGALDVQECRMVCGDSESPLDLRVWSRPISVGDEVFTVFFVVDISDEKRRKALERIFFHDVLNTAGGMKGLADLLVESNIPDPELSEIVDMMSESAQQLVEEISVQRMLAAAEAGDLKTTSAMLGSQEVMHKVVRQLHADASDQGKALIICDDAVCVDFVSDPVLVRRVLVNMVKNAMEAVPRGDVVTLNCCEEGDEVVFTVHDAVVIPQEIQRQLFTRSFSTKGSGRGLGTYSIKLLTERYLKGQVSFVSDENQGTVFTVRFPRTVGAGDDG